FNGITTVAEAAHASRGELLAALLSAPVIAALGGFPLAWWCYLRDPAIPDRIAQTLRAPYLILCRKYFVDEIYGAVIVRPLLWLSTTVLWHGLDEAAIDGTVNAVAHGTGESGDRLRHVNSGNMRSYAVWIVMGAVVLTTLLVW